MLGGIYYGAQYGGSITVDPRQRARRAIIGGDRDRGLSDGATGPGRAGARDFGDRVVRRRLHRDVRARDACARLRQVRGAFGAPEYFALATFGIVLTVALSHGSVMKGIAMAAVGVLFGLIGSDVFT